VLKGSETVITDAQGRTLLSPFSNPALATAGTGDVLAGAIAGLMAQGVQPFESAGLGVYLHAAAAELYASDYGPSGLLASEVATGLARVAARLRRGE
jgi:NAD(P)H-hydrate epimerase